MYIYVVKVVPPSSPKKDTWLTCLQNHLLLDFGSKRGV